MNLFHRLFGNKDNKIVDFINREAVILDVRTKEEFALGAIAGAKNFDLQQLPSKIKTISQWNKPVITCCASGIRSARALALIEQHGIEVVNGGSWQSLAKKL
ncbi:rhodanese-like domain-containing protein [Flavobacteriaceae bacterium]|nr:rhodanese-like domain-containing protein [Flavobacteriaceae bacterium]